MKHEDITHQMNQLTLNEHDRVLKLKQELNIDHGNIKVSEPFLGMVNGFLTKHLDRAGRLRFYSWAFDRTIAHGKLITPANIIKQGRDLVKHHMATLTTDEEGIETITPIHGKPFQIIKYGLKPKEAFNLILWLGPMKRPEGEKGYTHSRQADIDVTILIQLFKSGAGQMLLMDLNHDLEKQVEATMLQEHGVTANPIVAKPENKLEQAIRENALELDLWQCMTCGEDPQYTRTEAFEHLKEVHGIDLKIAKGERKMTAHLDSSKWFGTNYDILIEGVSLKNFTRTPRRRKLMTDLGY